MRLMLILFAVATLGLSGFAAWFFFGGPEDDPTRVRLTAHAAEIEALGPAAEGGDVQAQYALARLHHADVFGVRDLEAAFRWYSEAARQRHPGAQYALGTMYAKGEGVRQDPYRAAEWYRLAANLGRSADAQAALGELYFQGRGVPRDAAEARDWYRKAARRGHPAAQHLLGDMIAEGWAGRPDPVEAYTWFSLALPARDRLMALDPPLDPKAALERIARDMTDEQIRRAQAAVRAWRPEP